MLIQRRDDVGQCDKINCGRLSKYKKCDYWGHVRHVKYLMFRLLKGKGHGDFDLFLVKMVQKCLHLATKG